MEIELKRVSYLEGKERLGSIGWSKALDECEQWPRQQGGTMTLYPGGPWRLMTALDQSLGSRELKRVGAPGSARTVIVVSDSCETSYVLVHSSFLRKQGFDKSEHDHWMQVAEGRADVLLNEAPIPVSLIKKQTRVFGAEGSKPFHLWLGDFAETSPKEARMGDGIWLATFAGVEPTAAKRTVEETWVCIASTRTAIALVVTWV